MDEEKLELKAVFPLLKKWYGPAQRSKYGDLPLFWQDLQTWSHRRAVLKDFENAQQEQQRPSHASSNAAQWTDYQSDDPLEKYTLAERRMMLARLRLEDVVDKLSKVVVLAREAEKDPNRSPSPQPIYNQDGVRINTREVRMRQKFTDRKKELVDEILRVKQQSSDSTGGDRQATFTSGSKLIQRKIYIPVKDFPGKNFIGLIIGPRGNTQKQLEGETGCKISIRGKGSVKEGRQAKPEDEADELHVIVTGPTEEAVDRAAEMVEELLRPMDDQDNLHKQKQLEQLAKYNGTYRDFDTCHRCGEKGHKQWECPQKRAAEMANSSSYGGPGRGRGYVGQVQCRYCGEYSHPSSDCPTRRVHPPMQSGFPNGPQPPVAPAGPAPVAAGVEDKEFMDFWQEVSGQPTAGAPPVPSAPAPPMQQYAPPSAPYVPPQPSYPVQPPSYPVPPPSFPAQPPPPVYVAPPPMPMPPPGPPAPPRIPEPPRRY